MNFDGKLTGLVAMLACLSMAVFAQPGFGPGPAPGRGGPGGSGGPGGPTPRGFHGGPGPSMGAPQFMGGPGAPGQGPSRSMPPSMGSHNPYPSAQGTPMGVPSTRFGSVPNRAETPMRPEMQRMGPNMPPRGAMAPGAPAPADVGRMQQALRQRDYATIGKESEDIRDRTQRIQNMGPELPVQDRIQIPLINHMYRQGADLMEEGRNTRDDAKIRMGIQQIDQANEKFDRLKGSSDRGRGHNSKGRR